jgi:quinoprotein glucose dehydrogenase
MAFLEKDNSINFFFTDMKFKYSLASFLILSIIAITAWKSGDPKYVNWAEYLGGPDRNHYSELTQINAQNVDKLKIAWTYTMPDSGQMQTNALVIDGVVYGVSPKAQAFALDAETGKELWKFEEKFDSWASTIRGVAYWTDGKESRILSTVGPNLYALDAKTGKKILSFGENGKVDLHIGLPEIAKDKFIISNTPGTIFEDLIIMPVRLSEDADAAPGDIKAYNVRTGKLEWTFHTIPYPGEAGYETFPPDAYKNTHIGAANNWAGMSIDRKTGVVYVPTGSASYDFYGGRRHGKNLYSNCLLALNARTGKRIWHFQTIHHDIWDRDLPAPPNLITLNKNGKKIEAVAQVTKGGYVFVFDRHNGRPIYPIKETPVPGSKLAQPIPTMPAPYARQSEELSENEISPFAENKDELKALIRKYRTERFAAPSREGTVIFPGYDGGAEWGGAAVDPDGIMYVNSNEMAWILTMVEAPKLKEMQNLTLGAQTYKLSCSTCHGADLKGNPASNYPTLVGIEKKLNRVAIANLIKTGKDRMPGFGHLKTAEKQAVVDFILGTEKKEVTSDKAIANLDIDLFRGTGYNKFLDSKGLPAISPPWGTFSAINLNTGQYLWKQPFGTEPTLADKTTGSENYGGPVVTASGLLFIAATKDGIFRVFDKKTGKLLWQTKLPFASFATPATYAVNGKQYIVLSCGGTKLGAPKGNQYVAYALP